MVDLDHTSQGRLIFYLDGAHTPESMATCAEWFASEMQQRAGPTYSSRGQSLLLFNCMRERDPAVLLPELAAALHGSGVHLRSAVFAPALSVYGSILGAKGSLAAPPPTGSAAAAAAADCPAAEASAAEPAVDLSWQECMKDAWQVAASSSSSSSCNSSFGNSAGGSRSSITASVIPSLPDALAALRQVAAAAPPGQCTHVLVTGSLYLVGDMLRLLGQVPR